MAAQPGALPDLWTISLFSLGAVVSQPRACTERARRFSGGHSSPQALAAPCGVRWCAQLLRGAGCTVNDLWDRELDARVERTRSRPLASGALQPWQALGASRALRSPRHAFRVGLRR